MAVYTIAPCQSSRGFLMFAHISKSARYLVITSCFSSISGCSSDGGLSEMAAMGMLVGGAATGDTGLAVAGVAGYVGVMIVAPILADGSESETLPASSPGTVAPARTTSAMATPLAAQQMIAAPAKPESTSNYCYAYLTVGEERGSTCSPVVEINDADRTGAAFQTRLNNYVEKVKQSQPGVWGDFEYSQTLKMQNAFIYQMKPKTDASSKQDAGLICYVSRADAEAQLKRSQKNDSSMKIVAWP